MPGLYEYLTRNKYIAIGLILYALVIVIPVTYQVFFVLAVEMNMAVATAYGTLMAFPPCLLAFAKWRMGGKDEPLQKDRMPPGDY